LAGSGLSGLSGLSFCGAGLGSVGGGGVPAVAAGVAGLRPLLRALGRLSGLSGLSGTVCVAGRLVARGRGVVVGSLGRAGLGGVADNGLWAGLAGGGGSWLLICAVLGRLSGLRWLS